MLSSFTAPLMRQARAWALPLLALAAGFATPAQAAAPKAPTNLVLKSTLNTTPPGNATTRVFRLTWQDNSLDESGFRVELRLGNAGAFSYVDSLPAGTTEYNNINNPFTFAAGAAVQFRVVAFKHNGTKVESSTSATVEEVVVKAASNLTAPANFRVAAVNDGVLRFSWKDLSSSEFFFQIFYKKQVEAATAYKPLGSLHWFDNKEGAAASVRTEVLVQHGLAPGEAYTFRLRATRTNTATGQEAPSNTNSAFAEVEAYPTAGLTYYTVPQLNAATELTGEPADAERVTLRWKDNSFNETAYEISYRRIGATEWSSSDVMTLNPNTTTFTISVGPGGSYEWRVRPVFKVSGGATLGGEYTVPHTIMMDFIKPEGLVATTSGVSGAIDLEWDDTSEGELNYDIYSRIVDEETANDQWYYVQSMLADTTRATVTQRSNVTNVNDFFQNSTMVPLELNVEHEFKLVATYGDSSSDSSNTDSAFARHGFTSRTYHPAKVGQPFTYTMAVSDASNRDSWSVTGLPQGLTFDPDTGKITGTPEMSAVVEIPMTVVYAGGQSATTTLTLRILKQETVPQMGASFPAVTLGIGTQFPVPLEDKFTDPEFEKAVRLETTMGDIDMMLFPSLTPEAVENFMGYVESGAYDGVIFHRSVPGFIVQGGAYVPVQAPNYFSSIAKRPAAENEPGISNLRGTVAHAKVGGNPDSATHDFFFNLEDNSLKEGIELDNQNAGFTVFARLAGNGMDLVDDIADLPIGPYGTGANNGVILDGSEIKSSSKSAFQETPMNVTTPTAPASMDINATVQIRSAREVGAFKYTITSSNPSVVRTSVGNGILRVDGMAEGSSTITVKANDLDNNPLEQSFTVTVLKGHKAPLITRQPVAVAVQPGKKATLSVTATGTDLTYQWRKDGTPISGATAKSFVIAAVQAGDVGSYDVLVGNATTVLTSQAARVDFRTAPAIVTQPVKKVVEVGQPLELTAAATGAPAPVITWLRSGKTVAKQKDQTLKIPAATVTDGGAYVMRAKNVEGTAESSAAAVIVVDKSSHLVISQPNKTIVLKAQVSGPNLTYQWKRNGSNVSDDGERFSGSGTATLTIKKFGTTVLDMGNYTCFVRNNAEGIEAETGAWRLGLAGAVPTLTAFEPDLAFVGIDYDYTIPGGGEDNMTISSFAVTGLPAGLKVNTTTGKITGNASKAGEYRLKVTVRNPKGSVVVSDIPFYVLPMPEAVVGAFVGQIGNSPVFNNNKGGRVDMFVTEGGAISGKLSQGKEVLSFTGQMSQTPGALRTTGVATVKRKGGLPPLDITLTALTPSGYSDSGNVTGLISDGTNAVVFVAYRSIYNVKGRLSPYVGRQHLDMTLTEEEDIGDESIPQGHSYAIAMLDSKGIVKVTGRLADGTTLTSSSFLGGSQQFLIYQSLYKHTGALVGQLGLTYLDTVNTNTSNPTNRVRADGQMTWTKELQSSANERNYKNGFGPLTLNVLGMTYVSPGDNSLALGVPKEDGNASIEFDEGGLEDTDINPDATLNIGRTPLIPSGVTNEADVKLTITAATGLFKGSFVLESATEPKRTATINGLIRPQIPTIPARTYSDGSSSPAVPGADSIGAGHFLLGQLPSNSTQPPTTLKTAPILSGSAEIQPIPITITTHPVAQTVNKNVNVTFTVVATVSTANTALTYQWRLNGVNIANATNSSLTVTSVDEGDQGNYDVVIRSKSTAANSTATYSTRISNRAFLDVNDDVNTVVIARTPSTNPVLTNSGVPIVFTVTAKGVGPFTYQWFKVGAESTILSETASYTIESPTDADTADYNVKVTSTTTNSIKYGTANVLTVSSPLTEVVIKRTPADAVITYATPVEFSIATIDSAEPYQYQWYKVEGGVDVPIPNATEQKYSIPGVVNADAGFYKLKVSNAITATPVESNIIELQVNSAVGYANLIRTPSQEYVAVGLKVTFSPTIGGQPPFTYEWRKDGILLEDETLIDLVINNVSPSDNGSYQVIVRNATTPNGVQSNAVPLLVQLPIATVAVTVTNDNLNPALGDNIQLTATPDKPGPYSFQWFKDNEEIEGATAQTYAINGFTEDDYGNYSVNASNSANLNTPITSPILTLSAPAPTEPENP